MSFVTDVVDLVQARRVSVREAVAEVVAGMSRDELEAAEFARLVDKAGRELRKAAYLYTTTAEQFCLFEMGRAVPKVVRCEIGGEELYLPWQDATPGQVEEHYAWAEAKARRHLGIIERDRAHWTRYDGPMDRPLGWLRFGDVPCAICGLAWRVGDPYERAHDTPVADGLGDQVMRWAHRSCNRSEGTGGRESF
jgi:hypothetical protein